MSQSPSLRERVRKVIESPEGGGRVFDLTFQVLILASLVSFVVDTEPGLPSHVRRGLHAFEVFTVAAFSVEYLLRLWVSRTPMRYVFSFWGLVDVVAILPFYLGAAVDLRSVRVVRLLRLVRVLRLARYGAAARRFRRAYELIKHELVLFLVTSIVLIYIVSVRIYFFERSAQPEAFGSIGRCVWWAVVTLTTVGYGDAFPITMGGRVFTTGVLLIGLGVVAVPSGMVASALSETAREDARQPAD